MKAIFKGGNRHGFSLVEVVIAIGIVSFAVLAIMGLLPTGLKTVKNSNEQAAAANAIGAIAEAIRAGNATGWSYNGTNYDYSAAVPLNNLTLEGKGSSGAVDSRLVAIVIFTASPTDTTPGSAMISVAWPAGAVAAPNNGSPNWSGSDGVVTVGIQFLIR